MFEFFELWHFIADEFFIDGCGFCVSLEDGNCRCPLQEGPWHDQGQRSAS
jgi:hypothetical protein